MAEESKKIPKKPKNTKFFVWKPKEAFNLEILFSSKKSRDCFFFEYYTEKNI
jgi:hypothetical protein